MGWAHPVGVHWLVWVETHGFEVVSVVGLVVPAEVAGVAVVLEHLLPCYPVAVAGAVPGLRHGHHLVWSDLAGVVCGCAVSVYGAGVPPLGVGAVGAGGVLVFPRCLGFEVGDEGSAYVLVLS